MMASTPPTEMTTGCRNRIEMPGVRSDVERFTAERRSMRSSRTVIAPGLHPAAHPVTFPLRLVDLSARIDEEQPVDRPCRRRFRCVDRSCAKAVQDVVGQLRGARRGALWRRRL